MSKTDKELAVVVATAVIEANSVKLAVAPNSVKHQTQRLSLDEINAIIQSVHTTLRNLPENE